jgi:hypothetical protein
MKLSASRRSHGSSIVEMSMLMFAVVGFIMLPIGDMFAMLAGFGFSQASTDYMALEASKGLTLTAVQQNLISAAQRYHAIGIAQLLNINPIGGYLNSGADFYVVETNIYTGNATYYGPNSLPAKVDQTSNNYELCLKSKFNIGPLFNLPYFAAVPGMGKPAQLSFAVFRPIEHLTSLIASQITTTIATGPTGLTGNSTDWLGKATVSNWSYPYWGYQTLMPNQQILQNNTLNIYAANSNWTDTHVSVNLNQRMSINILNAWSSTGEVPWQINGQLSMFWGNGTVDPTNGLGNGELVVKIGANGVPFYISPGYNITPPASGEIYMMCNDMSYTANALQYQVNVMCTN